jgi:hypothetical protein
MKEYPRYWKNKKSGQIMKVMPWLETVADTVINAKEIPMPKVNTPWKFGMLVQIGYLIENEHGVWFGVGPKAKVGFKDLGEKKP